MKDTVRIPDIEDVLQDIAKDVPKSEWDQLPFDLTDRLDYYIYDFAEKV